MKLEEIWKKIVSFFKKLFGFEKKVTFQEGGPLINIISSSYTLNEKTKYVYYSNINSAIKNYINDTKNLISTVGQPLKPYWDIRYVNQINYNSNLNHGIYTGLDASTGIQTVQIGTHSSVIDESACLIQSEIIDNTVTAGTTLNLHDAPEQSINYGGPQSTFIYQLKETPETYPWLQYKNLMLQAFFNKPIYINYSGNKGGNISFGVILFNKKLNRLLNYVISVYGYGSGYTPEHKNLMFDTSNNIIHISTVIDEDTIYCTKSPYSEITQEVVSTPKKKTIDNNKWEDFFRVNISYNDLLAVLKEKKENSPSEASNQDFGLSPEDWRINSIMIQYELEESGGKGLISGSFQGFDVYASDNPL